VLIARHLHDPVAESAWMTNRPMPPQVPTLPGTGEATLNIAMSAAAHAQ
jgi:hypothetical protein